QYREELHRPGAVDGDLAGTVDLPPGAVLQPARRRPSRRARPTAQVGAPTRLKVPVQWRALRRVRCKRSVRLPAILSSNLLNPVTDVYSDSGDILATKFSTMHDDVSRPRNDGKDAVCPLNRWHMWLEMRPVVTNDPPKIA